MSNSYIIICILYFLIFSYKQDTFLPTFIIRKTYDNEPEKIEFMSFRSYEIFALHVKENQHFYKLYFEMNTTFPLKDGLEEMWEAMIVPYFHDRGIYDEEVMALRFICYQAGFTITLKKWMDQNCHLKIQEVAQILTECLRM